MTGKFYLDGAGLSPLSDIHTDVAGGLSQLTGTGAPQANEVAQSFGKIASQLSAALGGTIQSRAGALRTTEQAGHALAGKLKKAHHMYTGGDEHGAADIKSTMKAFGDEPSGTPGPGVLTDQRTGNDNPVPAGPTAPMTAGGAGAPSGGGSSGAPSSAGAPSTSGAGAPSANPGAAAASAGTASASPRGAAAGAGASSGGQGLSQVLSQIGQQVGSAVQSVGQGVQGLGQTLGQLPQQVMQGVTQLTEQGGSAEPGAGGPGAGDPNARPDTQQTHRAGAQPGTESAQRPSQPAARHTEGPESARK
jgi:hypothetical protein